MQRKFFIFVVAVVCCLTNVPPSRGGNIGLAAGATSSVSNASVLGKIRFDGPLPKSSPIAMRSDPACAAEHPQPVHNQDVVAGQDGTLENVIVFVSQGAEEHAYDLPQNPAVIEQKGCMYEPHVLAMRAGQTLRVVNADKTTHNIHPWMHSYIAVFKHPFFAVTGKDGGFELKNLPPGEYTIEAWHEKLGTMTQHVKIAQGESKQVDFTFKPHS